MAYKAVCFDIDGTLYPIGVMNWRLVRIAVHHLPFCRRYLRNRKEFRRCQGTFTQDVPLRWREAMIIQNGTGQETQTPFCEEDYRATYDRLHKCIYDPMRRLYRKTRAFDGVRETLQGLKDRGVKVGVFTDFPLFDCKLEGLGIADLVDVSASSDDVGRLKPDTHCLQYLLYNLKLESSEVLYVGDSYEKDIVGATSIGMDAVLVNAKDPKGDYPLAKAVFTNWNDFDKWLTARMGETL